MSPYFIVQATAFRRAGSRALIIHNVLVNDEGNERYEQRNESVTDKFFYSGRDLQ